MITITDKLALGSKFLLEDLEGLPTLSVGQADNLKYESDSVRVWLSRCDMASGEPYDNKVTIVQRIDGNWVTVNEYPARQRGQP